MEAPTRRDDKGMYTRWDALAERVLAGDATTREDAHALMRAPDHEILALLAAAYRVRHHHYGATVHLHLLLNAKSGLCPEDCHYCSQSRLSTAPIPKYPIQSRATILQGADRAADLHAATYCIVASGRGPTPRELAAVADAVRAIKDRHPHLKVCCCLGLLKDGQADILKQAGVDRYNHNLNTSAVHTPHVVTTHTYADRLRTIERVKQAGLSPCSGAIFGMGESDDDVVDTAFALRAIDADSIPVNFLHPIPGTPFAALRALTPPHCLKILALMRLVNPAKEIRIAGGREHNLRSLQPLGLYAANSIFIGDYLTTGGQPPAADLAMLADLGFTVEAHPALGG